MPRRAPRKKKQGGGKRKKKSKSTTPLDPPVEEALVKQVPDDTAPPMDSAARAALKKNLKSRLRTRQRMMRTARFGGSSQEIQKIMKNFNDGDDEKAELMKEIQDDVKGMKQKDAKKYLKQVISGMNTDQTDSFMDMVKDKIPGQSGDIVNYVKRHRKIKDQEDQNKPQVNPETVYVPVRLMTDEQKAAAKLLRRMEQAAPAATVESSELPPPIKKKKKKKSFGKVNIHVPKITELRNHPASDDSSSSLTNDIPKPTSPPKSDPSKKKKKKKFHKQGAELEDINSIFSGQTDQAKEMAKLSFSARMTNVDGFNANDQATLLRQFLFESSEITEVVRVAKIEFLPLTPLLAIPGTEEFVDLKSIPPVHWPAVEKGAEAFDPSEGWAYRKISNALDLVEEKKEGKEGKEGKYARVRNAHASCARFLQRFQPISAWLKSLEGTQVPWQWFTEMLNNMGIICQRTEQPRSDKDKEWKECFRVLCEEYKDFKTGKMTVPIVPYVRITLRC